MPRVMSSEGRRPTSGRMPTLLPLPHNRCGLWKGHGCGAEGRGEGGKSLGVPPHPSPLPRSEVCERRPCRLRGRGNRNLLALRAYRCSPTFWRTSLRSNDRLEASPTSLNCPRSGARVQWHRPILFRAVRSSKTSVRISRSMGRRLSRGWQAAQTGVGNSASSPAAVWCR